jgi:hypothetical protein
MEPCGPVQACNGIALPLPVTYMTVCSADNVSLITGVLHTVLFHCCM